MKKILPIIFLLSLFQLGNALAYTRYNQYDDPATRDTHSNIKTHKKHDAKKLSFKQKTKFQIMKLKPFKVKNFSFTNPTNIDFSDIYSKYTNRVISDKELKVIINQINKRLRDKGYILSFAFTPKQHFNSGDVDLRILHGKIKDVKVVSDIPVTKNDLFNSYVNNILDMSPVMNADLQKNIQLINQIPGYRIKYNLEPIKDGGNNNEIADLVILVDKKAGDINLASNNQGSKSIGKYQFSSLVNLYNTLNQNERVTIYAGTTNKSDAMKITTLDIEKFINSYGTSVNLLASYIEDNPYVVLPGNAKKNKSTMYRASLNHHLYLTHDKAFQIVGGYEHRKSDNYTPGLKISDSKYGNVFVGANVEFPDFMGGKNYGVVYNYNSIKNQTKNNRYSSIAEEFDKSYNFTTLELFRDQKLPSNFSIFSQFLGQYSSDKLPIDQQFFVGGLTAGRGYKNGILASNKGYDFNAELRYTYAFKHNDLVEEIQPYSFYDIVGFSKKFTNANKSNLQSAGVGLRMRTKYDFNFIFEGGFPFKKDVIINNDTIHNSNKFSFLVNKTFEF